MYLMHAQGRGCVAVDHREQQGVVFPDAVVTILNLAAIDPSGRPAHLRAAGYAYTAARRHLSLLPDKHRDLSGLAQAADILFAELRSQEQIHGLPGGVTMALDGMGSE